MTRHEDIDRLLATPVSRRVVLQGSAAAGAAAFLAACGGGGATGSPGATTDGGGTGAISGPLNWANWPGYMDWDESGAVAPTLTDYTAKTGVEVNYSEEIESNEDFVATINPQLEAGADTGWDMITLTDYMAARLIERGWLEEIDPAKVPTAVENLKEDYKGRSWDPEQTFHYPYQTFADGVGYNRVSTGMDLTSVADMFLPQFAGKVTMINAYQDTFSMIGLMLRDKGDISNLPADFTNEDGDKIFAFLKPYVDDGFIRAFQGNEYIQEFGSGDTWVSIVWSGDLANSGGPDDRFVYPKEGLVASTDNMLIPKGAAHKDAALAMIDHLYDVAIAARLSAGIKYISPVFGADEAIAAIDPELATNPLIFPPPDVLAMTYEYPAYGDEKDAYFQDLIDQLMGA
ncbi:MAG: spermidine/putrescine ABC transporter substrate-binding protein [Candidatus Limnocylindrales bacterium]